MIEDTVIEVHLEILKWKIVIEKMIVKDIEDVLDHLEMVFKFKSLLKHFNKKFKFFTDRDRDSKYDRNRRSRSPRDRRDREKERDRYKER